MPNDGVCLLACNGKYSWLAGGRKKVVTKVSSREVKSLRTHSQAVCDLIELITHEKEMVGCGWDIEERRDESGRDVFFLFSSYGFYLCLARKESYLSWRRK